VNNHVLKSKIKYEFHISGAVRKKYKFNEKIFSTEGNVIFADFKAVREFVFKFNVGKRADEKVFAGDVNAIGLLDEIFHFILRKYEEDSNNGVFERLYKFLNLEIGSEPFYRLLFEFTEKFPPSEVYSGKVTVLDYLQNYSGPKPNYEVVLEELILLYFII